MLYFVFQFLNGHKVKQSPHQIQSLFLLNSKGKDKFKRLMDNLSQNKCWLSNTWKCSV